MKRRDMLMGLLAATVSVLVPALTRAKTGPVLTNGCLRGYDEFKHRGTVTGRWSGRNPVMSEVSKEQPNTVSFTVDLGDRGDCIIWQFWDGHKWHRDIKSWPLKSFENPKDWK